LIPHGDKVDVITPNNKLFGRGGQILTPHEDNLMLLPQSTYCSEGVAQFYVVMMMMMIMIMPSVSVEQRPGWGEHV
jgi:hypothetical protein